MSTQFLQARFPKGSSNQYSTHICLLYSVFCSTNGPFWLQWAWESGLLLVVPFYSLFEATNINCMVFYCFHPFLPGLLTLTESPCPSLHYIVYSTAGTIGIPSPLHRTQTARKVTQCPECPRWMSPPPMVNDTTSPNRLVAAFTSLLFCACTLLPLSIPLRVCGSSVGRQ